MITNNSGSTTNSDNESQVSLNLQNEVSSFFAHPQSQQTINSTSNNVKAETNYKFGLNFDECESPSNSLNKNEVLIKLSSPVRSSTLDLSVEEFSLRDHGAEWYENEIASKEYADGEDYLMSWFITN